MGVSPPNAALQKEEGQHVPLKACVVQPYITEETRESDSVAQGHTASQQQGQDQRLGLLTPSERSLLCTLRPLPSPSPSTDLGLPSGSPDW